MRDALWRIACVLAALFGLVFGLWAGAGVARAEEDADLCLREPVARTECNGIRGRS